MNYRPLITAISALYLGCAASQPMIVETQKLKVTNPCIRTFDFAGRRISKNVCQIVEKKEQVFEPIVIPTIDYQPESITDILKTKNE